jgi:hypothetical protein
MKIPEKVQSLWDKYSGPLSTIYFLAGFVLQNLMPKRIDLLLNDIILLAYLVICGLCMILSHRAERRKLENGTNSALAEYYPMAIQFFLGTLYSNYVVFYFQSASGLKTFLFIMILILLLFMNKFFKEKLVGLTTQIGMYFLACFSFVIFFLPIMTKEMNKTNFLIGGAASVGFTFLIILLIRWVGAPDTKRSVLKVAGLIVVLYGLLNLLYFKNWIPPVPMALKFAGMVHRVNHGTDGWYTLQYESPESFQFWRKTNYTFHFAPDDTIYCFSAIFAPTEMKKTIYHLWEQYRPEKGEWVTQYHLSYDLAGGRDGGYRGYSYKTVIPAGEWRVEIVTEDDLVLGSTDFKIVNTDKDRIKLTTIQR